MRQFLAALVILLALYLTLSHFTEVRLVWETLRRGNLFWLALGTLVQITWLINTAQTYRAIYRLLDMQISLRRLAPPVATGNFVNVVAPSGGVSGVAGVGGGAGRHDLSTARVTIAGVLFVLFEYFGFLCVLALGLIVLIRRNSLNAAEIGASAVLLDRKSTRLNSSHGYIS